jgi:sugar/nucleoside kinase (ribokinase family)
MVLCYEVPHLDGVRSTVGAGDCATGILLAHIASGGLAAPAMAEAFADALAAASASCLTDVPAQFDPADADRLRSRLRWRVVTGT